MQIIALNGVTATTTGTGRSVENLTKLSVQVSATAISAGNGAFTIEGSNDGTNWDTLMFIRTVANTNAQQITRDVSVTLSSNTNEMLLLDDFIGCKMLRVSVTVTTDGTYTAIINGQKIAV